MDNNYNYLMLILNISSLSDVLWLEVKVVNRNAGWQELK